MFLNRSRTLLRDLDTALDEGDEGKVRVCLAAIHARGIQLPHDAALLAAQLLSDTGSRLEALRLIHAMLAKQPDDAGAAALLRAVGDGNPKNAPAEPATRPNETPPEEQAHAHLAEADRLRDAGAAAEAAEGYALALSFCPDRTDWRIQLANMLKDSGRAGEAEIEYRRVILERPEDSDAYLQLGHALKSAGRPEEAAIAYRGAVERDPDNGSARFELMHLGDPADRYGQVLDALDRHEMTAVFRLADAMAAMRDDLDRLLRRIPTVSARTVFPPSLHATYRRLMRMPPARLPVAPPRMVVLFDADHGEPGAFHARLSGLVAQDFPLLQVVAFGRDPARRRAVEQLATGDARLSWRECEGPGGLQAQAMIAADLDADILLLPGPGAMLDSAAAGWFAHALVTHAAIEAAYCDSESGRLGEAEIERFDPVLRACFDRDSLVEVDAVGQTLAVRREAFLRCADTCDLAAADGRRRLVLSLAATAPLAHVPLFLACDLDPDPVSGTARPLDGEGEAGVFADERIAVIIPSRDNGADVADFVASLLETARSRSRLDIIVVDNGARAPETLGILARLQVERGITVLRRDVPFNWSVLNNDAVEAAPDAGLLVFANDDMKMLTPHWDVEIRRLLARADVGAVGAKLLYPDATLQHVGIVCGWAGRTVHEGRGEPGDSPGHAGRWRARRSVSAVTGAFLATRRETFAEIGGFDPHLPVSYNDVDYCLSVRARGQKVLWTPHIVLNHHESKSRGFDRENSERCARDEAEHLRLRRRWGGALDGDPSINPGWAQVLSPFQAYRLAEVAEIERYIAASVAPEPWRVSRADTRG